MAIDKINLATVEKMWRREVEAAATYRHLADREGDPRRKDILIRLAQQEEIHAARWSERIALTTGHAPNPQEVERGLSWFQRISDPNVVLHRLEQEENKAEAEYDQLMSKLSDPDRSPDRRRGDARGARSRRDPADAGRRSDSRRRGRRSIASSAASAGMNGAPAGSATPSTASTTASARCSASSPGWPATRAAAKSCSPPASPARSRARCRWAPAPTSRRNRSAKCTSPRWRANGLEIEEDPHEELLELELFYQLKGFSVDESRASSRSDCRSSRRSFCARSCTRSSASTRTRSRIPGAPRSPQACPRPSAASSRSSRSSSPSACRRSSRRSSSARWRTSRSARRSRSSPPILVVERRRDDDGRGAGGGGDVRVGPRLRRTLMAGPADLRVHLASGAVTTAVIYPHGRARRRDADSRSRRRRRTAQRLHGRFFAGAVSAWPRRGHVQFPLLRTGTEDS